MPPIEFFDVRPPWIQGIPRPRWSNIALSFVHICFAARLESHRARILKVKEWEELGGPRMRRMLAVGIVVVLLATHLVRRDRDILS